MGPIGPGEDSQKSSKQSKLNLALSGLYCTVSCTTVLSINRLDQEPSQNASDALLYLSGPSYHPPVQSERQSVLLAFCYQGISYLLPQNVKSLRTVPTAGHQRTSLATGQMVT